MLNVGKVDCIEQVTKLCVTRTWVKLHCEVVFSASFVEDSFVLTFHQPDLMPAIVHYRLLWIDTIGSHWSIQT